MRPLALALAAAVVALAACGGEPEGDGSAGGAGAGTKTHTVAQHGFSVALPAGWKAITPSEVLNAEELESFREENPEIEAYVDAISGPESPIEFLAFDPDVEQEFATNLNVVVLALDRSVGLEQWAEAATAEIENLPSRTGDLETERVTLPAGEALRLRYEQEFNAEGGSRTVSTTQYGLVADGRSFILTFTTLPRQERAYRATFEAAARSFRLGE